MVFDLWYKENEKSCTWIAAQLPWFLAHGMNMRFNLRRRDVAVIFENVARLGMLVREVVRHVWKRMVPLE